jgi:hypothetical protein
MKNNINKFPRSIKYDENGYSISKFPKDDYYVRLRIDHRNSTIFIVRDDNLLMLFKKKVKTTKRLLLQRRAKVYIMKFCGIELPKVRRFKLRGKHVKTSI